MVTGKDVARLAGVSQSAVSLALRNDARISPATKAKILEAARTLGYTPSQLGRSLATRRTGRIAVVAGELSNPFYPALIAPLHDALISVGYGMVLVTDGQDRTDLAPIFDGSIDGVVLAACTVTSPVPRELSRANVPFVFLNREVDGVVADAALPDNDAGVEALVRMLYEHGHRRFGLISGPSDVSTARARHRAYQRMLADRDVALRSEHVIVGNFSHRTGQDGFRALAEMPSPPTAIFCANDVIALGALDAAIADGISIPGQFSIIGFDDIPTAAWAAFELTTVRVDLSAMATAAADLLLRKIDDQFLPPERVLVQSTLMLRNTHGPAPR
jgi:LacI family transcriptional regulator